MNWLEKTSDWGRFLRGLKVRFPFVNEREIENGPQAAAVIAEHVARQHDLTPLEAEEELKDWLYVQSLARQAAELDAR